jgi:hypothetical protein
VEVRLVAEAQAELAALPVAEAEAIRHSFRKLGDAGARLGFPHTSSVRGADRLRELRPRAGRSRWRAFYRQVGTVMWVGAIGPEATVDRLGFARAIRSAERRLRTLEGAG